MSFIRPGELYDESKVKTAAMTVCQSIRLMNSVTLLLAETSSSRQQNAAQKLTVPYGMIPGNSQGYKVNLEASSNSNGAYRDLARTVILP